MDTTSTTNTFPTADNPTLVPPGKATLDRVVESAHDTVDRLADRTAPTVQRVADGLDDAQTMLRERSEQARDTADRWTESLRETVRDNPIAAVAAALALGALIARL